MNQGSDHMVRVGRFEDRGGWIEEAQGAEKKTGRNDGQPL